jgi:hypothetical protein
MRIAEDVKLSCTLVTHAYNLSYLGGRDWEDWNSRTI